MSDARESWTEVVAPQLGVNDETVRVVAWRVTAGTAVQRGTVLAELETTKAAFELEAEADGYFYSLIEAGAEAPMRAALGVLLRAPDSEAVAHYRAAQAANAPVQASAGGPQLTAKAKALALQFGLDVATLPGGRILREEDIRAFVGAAEAVSNVPAPKAGDAVVYGASTGGMVVAAAMRSAGFYRPVAYIDDDPALVGTQFDGLPVWPGTQLEQLRASGIAGVGTHIAKASVRLALRARAAAAGVAMLNVIHARAYVAPTVRMGAGNLIKAGAIVDDHVQLGDCCIIDNGAVLPHHNRLGSGVHLAPGARFGGDCEVGDETIIGVGASVGPRLRIGRRVLVGVGAIVTRDVPDGAVVLGAMPEGRGGGGRR